MKIFRGIKSLRNILEGLKLNVGIYKGTIYLFNPFTFEHIADFNRKDSYFHLKSSYLHLVHKQIYEYDKFINMMNKLCDKILSLTVK